MRKHVRDIDISKIKKLAKQGHTCQTISNHLGINYDRVAQFYPKPPKVEAVETVDGGEAPTPEPEGLMAPPLKRKSKMPPPIAGSNEID